MCLRWADAVKMLSSYGCTEYSCWTCLVIEFWSITSVPAFCCPKLHSPGNHPKKQCYELLNSILRSAVFEMVEHTFNKSSIGSLLLKKVWAPKILYYLKLHYREGTKATVTGMWSRKQNKNKKFYLIWSNKRNSSLSQAPSLFASHASFLPTFFSPLSYRTSYLLSNHSSPSLFLISKN